MGASPQFVDLNGDGLQDVLFGSFSGVPQWLAGGAKGFGEPKFVTDRSGEGVSISKFWNDDTSDWDEHEGTGTKGHGSSAAAVDWDGDGDQDLLLGGYMAGNLVIRLNEGSATEPRFATENRAVEVNGTPVAFEYGIGTPRVVDWDGDGLFDIVVGTIYGGIYLLNNAGTKEEPRFDSMTTLVEPLPSKAMSKRIKQVAAANGQPTLPGSSFHVEIVDYDGDGDLDLLVGARSQWLDGPLKVLTDEEEAVAESLMAESDAAWAERRTLLEGVESEEAQEKVRASDEYQGLLRTYRSKRAESLAITKDPIAQGDFLWLFRRK